MVVKKKGEMWRVGVFLTVRIICCHHHHHHRVTSSTQHLRSVRSYKSRLPTVEWNTSEPRCEHHYHYHHHQPSKMSSFKTLLANLFLLTLLHHCQSLENSEENQQQPTFPHNSLNEPEELDIGEHPYLWQMAAFAARQLSNKESKVKLVTLTNAEKLDSTYRLRVTLQRVSRGNTPVDQSVSDQRSMIFGQNPKLTINYLLLSRRMNSTAR